MIPPNVLLWYEDGRGGVLVVWVGMKRHHNALVAGQRNRGDRECWPRKGWSVGGEGQNREEKKDTERGGENIRKN